MTKLQKRWNLDKMKIKVLQILEQRVKPFLTMNCLLLDFPNPTNSNKKRQDIRSWSFIISKEISLDISFGVLVKTSYLCWLL